MKKKLRGNFSTLRILINCPPNEPIGRSFNRICLAASNQPFTFFLCTIFNFGVVLDSIFETI